MAKSFKVGDYVEVVRVVEGDSLYTSVIGGKHLITRVEPHRPDRYVLSGMSNLMFFHSELKKLRKLKEA